MERVLRKQELLAQGSIYFGFDHRQFKTFGSIKIVAINQSIIKYYNNNIITSKTVSPLNDY